MGRPFRPGRAITSVPPWHILYGKQSFQYQNYHQEFIWGPNKFLVAVLRPEMMDWDTNSAQGVQIHPPSWWILYGKHSFKHQNHHQEFISGPNKFLVAVLRPGMLDWDAHSAQGVQLPPCLRGRFYTESKAPNTKTTAGNLFGAQITSWWPHGVPK